MLKIVTGKSTKTNRNCDCIQMSCVAWADCGPFALGTISRRSVPSVIVAGASDMQPVFNSYVFWTAPAGGAAFTALNIPPNGAYTQRLLIANVFSGTAVAGTRVCDVLAGAVVVLPAFDIIVAGSGVSATAVTVTLADGTLTLGFRSGDPIIGAAWQASGTLVRGAPSQRAADVPVAGAGKPWLAERDLRLLRVLGRIHDRGIHG